VGTRRGSRWLVVAVVLAAAYLLYEPPISGRSQTAGPIDLAGPVDASQCAPCHLRIAEALEPGIIFQHGNHLIVGCAACHYKMPHEGGKTYKPLMEACFNCHGVAHGPQGELASSKCSACHTPSFNLRPRDHTTDWAGKPHAGRARTGVNDCMMCHNAAKDCDVCHKQKGVRKNDGTPVGPMPPTYQSIQPMMPSRPSIMVFPDRPTSMGQCIYCHPDIEKFTPGRIIFAHADHLRRDYDCTVCHPQFGHGAEQVQRPPMETCYQCHGLVHAAQGLVATDACDKCHPKGFNLKPSDHTDAFVKRGHEDRANTDPSYCAMCHKPDFCVKCHQGRLQRPNGQFSARVIPADHKLGTWRGRHGQLFLNQQGSCGACHDSPSCTPCHYTPMPHPTDWLAGHGKKTHDIPADQRDCNVCHTDREKCQQCHHDRVKRAQLISSNCTPCHEIMKTQPPTSIKDRGMAEHAVHFNVAKKKGKPYTCDDCHVGFGTGAAQSQAQLQQGHDLRLCYGCHGASDIQNVLIAPWPGAQLCLRCHTNLNI
jgi:hypothetical protein